MNLYISYESQAYRHIAYVAFVFFFAAQDKIPYVWCEHIHSHSPLKNNIDIAKRRQ